MDLTNLRNVPRRIEEAVNLFDVALRRLERATKTAETARDSLAQQDSDLNEAVDQLKLITTHILRYVLATSSPAEQIAQAAERLLAETQSHDEPSEPAPDYE